MIHHGDLFDVLPTLPANSIDACICDPPYGIGFMGREWDTFKPDTERADAQRAAKNTAIKSDNPNLKGRRRSPAVSPSQIEYDYTVVGLRDFQTWTERWAREVFRVLRPGGHIVVCGAPRSHHRMMSGIEDAGFEIRDCLAWIFGQGFPKSRNLGRGWGTALKPAHEPIALARKPFKGSTQAAFDAHGVGGLNIAGCRVGPGEAVPGGGYARAGSVTAGEPHDLGRWPANVVLDVESAAALDEQSGERTSGHWPTDRGEGGYEGGFSGQSGLLGRSENAGGASRFYYVAKPSREERDYGCYDLAASTGGGATDRTDGSAGLNSPRAGAGRTGGARNIHPTVKPVALMQWLVRLVTPPDGVVLDPFTGSGTTGMACAYEQRRFVGVEREAAYVAIATRRIAEVAGLFSEQVVTE